MRTLAPSCAKRRAVASPSPLAAPVTIAVFPSSLPISEYLQSGAVARRAPSLEQRRKGDRPIAISVDQKPLVDVAVAAIISRRVGGENLQRALRFLADRLAPVIDRIARPLAAGLALRPRQIGSESCRAGLCASVVRSGGAD